MAFMPKAGSRVSVPGRSGLRPSPVMISDSPRRSSWDTTTVPWMRIW